MSISTELNKLEQNRQSIVDAVNAKGGELAENAPLNVIASAITDLPSGGGDTLVLLNGIIPSNAFAQSSLSKTDFRDCIFTGLGDKVFINCANMEGELKLPDTCKSIGREFIENTKINKLVLPPLVTTIPIEFLFLAAMPFEFICNDTLTTVSAYGFYSCSHCPKLDLPATVTSIGPMGFAGNYDYLKVVIIRAINPPALATNAFNDTTSHIIYVPDESVDAYKAATGWNIHADRIKPLSEYQDEAGR